MAASFARALRAENKSARTVTIYVDAVQRRRGHLAERGAPTDVRNITRGHVESFITHQLETKKANTAGSRFRALRRFFRWLVDEQEIERNPMDGMRHPTVPEVPVDIVAKAEMNGLLKATQGKDFAD